MADLLPRLLSFSPRRHAQNSITDEEYDKQIGEFITYLKQSLLRKTVFDPDVGGLLDVLDPSTHSLSYLFIFHFHVHAIQGITKESLPKDVQPGGALWSKALLFLKGFDSTQVRYAGQEWRRLVELVAKAAEAVSKPILALSPIRDAMLRLDPSCSTLTSNHILLGRLCLRARAYVAALPVIDKDICHFPTGSDQTYLKRCHHVLCAEHESSAAFITHTSGLSAKLTYRDHLQYFLYSGMIHMGLKQWKKALHFLNLLISAPCIGSVSMIMVEAYKKWVLVSLLENGTTIALSSITAPHAAKAYKSLARPYDALAEAFKCGDFDRLRGEIDVGQSIWHMVCFWAQLLYQFVEETDVFNTSLNQDNNTGLVLQLLVAFRRFSVLRLGTTFAALTIGDVAYRTSPNPTGIEETEIFVTSLIMSRTLDATLLQSSSSLDPTMLRFSVTTEGSRTSLEIPIREQLILERERLMVLMNKVEESDRKLEFSKEHIDNLRRSQKRKDDSAKDGANMVKGAGADIDEDMMGDLH